MKAIIYSCVLLMSSMIASCMEQPVSDPQTELWRLPSTEYVLDNRTNLCFLEFKGAYGYSGYTMVPCSPEVLNTIKNKSKAEVCK